MPPGENEELAGLSGRERLVAFILTKQGLGALIALLLLGFAGYYAIRQQNFQHEDMQRIADALEDVRDSIDAELKEHDVPVPKRRVVRPGERR